MFDLRHLSLFAFAALANAAVAGNVISTNLPANTFIVNIDGRNDGARSYDGDQSSWTRPFATDGNLLSLTLDPGTYRFNIVDPADAAALYPSLTAGQLATVGSAWSYNSPYTTSYFVFDSSAANDASQPQLFAGANQAADASGNYYFYDPNGGENAYHATKAAGQTDQLFTGSGGRFHGVEARTYTLTQRRTLLFVVPDYDLGDNKGFVSVAVSPVPEPASFAVLTIGGLGLLRRRRQPSTTRS